MPESGIKLLDHSDIITFEEIVKVVIGDEVNSKTLAGLYDEINHMLKVEEDDKDEQAEDEDDKEEDKLEDKIEKTVNKSSAEKKAKEELKENADGS